MNMFKYKQQISHIDIVKQSENVILMAQLPVTNKNSQKCSMFLCMVVF